MLRYVYRVLIFIKKITKALVLTISCLLFETIIVSFDFIGAANKDIKYISLDVVLLGGGGVIALWAIYSIFKRNISMLNILVKKYIGYIYPFMYVLGILLFIKCRSCYQLYVCIAEGTVACYLMDKEISKVYKYNIAKTTLVSSNYVEKPIVGINNLTSSQKKAFYELKRLIDSRNSTDSFNIALLGAWGSGKTSITETLICEYEKVKPENYFILKISVLSLKETQNVAEYVKCYFDMLFRKYEVGVFRVEVAFLTSLVRCLGDKISAADLFKGNHEFLYSDFEKEKELFAVQVAKLLKISGRKNILFFVDDVDRSEEETQIISLLQEFSSIEGIISIISLDKSRDIIIRPQYNNQNDRVEYNPMDKFIHVRIRVNEDGHIEYDEQIGKQIVLAFDGTKVVENCFVSCDGKSDGNSLFDSIKDYRTTEIINPRCFADSTYNILSEVFMRNYKLSSKAFGEYVENLISEYMYTSKELLPYISQMLAIPPEQWKQELFIVNAQWTKHSFTPNDFDWLIKMQSNSSTLFWTIGQMVESLESLVEERKEYRDIDTMEDVYDYWMIGKHFMDGRTWENRKEYPIYYSGLEQIRLIVFNDKEYEEINQNIHDGKYELVHDIMLDKMNGIANLYFLSMVLSDFMEYFRMVLNNYRLFKMQLREAELLNVNYLDYLVKEWHPRKELIDNYEKMKESQHHLSKIKVGFPSISAFFNKIIYENFITKFGYRFANEELKDSRMFLYHSKDNTIIVISKEQNNLEENIYIDVTGEIVNYSDILEDDIREIEIKNKLIWGTK